MQLTGQNWFTNSLSGGYIMTNGSHVCKLFGEAIKESVVCGHHIYSRWVRRQCKWKWQMIQPNSMRSSTMSDVFIVLFTFLAHLWLAICTSDPDWLFAKWSWFTPPSRACSNLSTCRIFRLAHSKFLFNYIEQCDFYWRSRQILSRRQHAPNKHCALNNNMCLITRFYGYIALELLPLHASVMSIIYQWTYIHISMIKFKPTDWMHDGIYPSRSCIAYHSASACMCKNCLL